MTSIYNNLLNENSNDGVQEVIEHDLLPAILEDREVDGCAVDMKVYGSESIVFDPDHIDSEGFEIARWDVDEHVQGTLVVTLRAEASALLASTEPNQVVAIRAIAKCTLSLSQDRVSGTSKVILATHP